ncbi:dermonecrotic toxin domain-containing protein [Pseudomonas sp. P1.8]|uniref:dermonecrotic toxin domain-containing protein n=1 Tax=Pseudomonas sp. P1.8 TaxID=1699310 RepID=UPI00069DEC13|nr:DUF6543 domain-containing protein [Pseudomonas sp. P1.8]
MKETVNTPLPKKSTALHETSQVLTVNDVAAQMLHQALKERFPTRDLDPDQTLIGTPQWQYMEGELSAGPILYETLTQALVRQFFTSSTANYLEGEHFLTRLPLISPVVHLSISIEEIGALLNDYAPLLFVLFGERQLAFWNGKGRSAPRWHELSDALRKMLNVQDVEGWDSDQCHVARAVSLDPDKQERKHNDRTAADIRACLIDIDTVDTEGTRHLMIAGAAVITGRYKDRDLVMMYTVEGGYESFDSLEKLGASLPVRIEDELAGRDMQWRLFEPDGDFFDHMAWALISTQIDTFSASTGGNPSKKNLHASTPEASGHSQLDKAIPDWLSQASAADLDVYSQSIKALGKLLRLSDSALYQIPPIADFALQKMCEAILADKKDRSTELRLDKLEITITNSFEASGLTLPNLLDRHTETLGEFALENEAPYLATLRFQDAHPVPDWLTIEYLTAKAAQVNIGEAYPTLIKSKLIEDKAQASLQESAFIQQLRATLALMALEHKLRQLGGVNEQGYRTLREWLEPTPDNQKPVVIRPLTLTHGGSDTGDTVTNMFIIAARDPGAAPCLLYRPLFEKPLLQFPSEQNLIYALHQPGELRDSVLAWLSDTALSFKYAQYAFPVGLPSPWLATQELAEPWTSITWAGPVGLSPRELTGDVFSFLFKSNALAMAELADRQSQSNAQRRWALLRDSGWAVFNVTSNFFSGAAGVAVWVWQAFADIQQALDAHERGDKPAQWSAMGDLLLMVGMVLAHRAISRRKTEVRPASKHGDWVETVPVLKPAALPDVKLIDTPLAGELPIDHYSSLEVGGSVPRRSPTALGIYLDSIKTTPPDLESKQWVVLKRGNAPLYQMGENMCAQVGERWFKVVEDDDGDVKISYPDNPERTGPLLINDFGGNWYLDLRLRLRGGAGGESLKSKLKARRQEKEKQKKELEAAIHAFKELEVNKRTAFDAAQEELTSVPEKVDEEKDGSFVTLLEQQITDYEQVLKQLQQWRDAGGSSSGYVYDLVRLTAELHKYICMWLVAKRKTYADITHVLTQEPEVNATPQTYVDSATKAIELSNKMVLRLQLSHTSLDRLLDVGEFGLSEVSKLRKLLPGFTEWDLKANEIAISFELCLKQSAEVDLEPARDAIAKVIVDATTASRTVAKLQKSTQVDTTTDNRVDSLSAQIDTLADADQRLQDLPGDFPEHLQSSGLEQVRNLILEFKTLAQTQLDRLLPSTLTLPEPATPKPAVAGPSRQAGKISKSRSRASIKPKEPNAEDQAFEEIMPIKARPTPLSERDDRDIVSEALDLDANAGAFIKKTHKDAQKPHRIPADMQDLFDIQANRMEQMAREVEHILAKPANKLGVANLPAMLRGNANRLREEGIKTRAMMLKARKPRQAYLQWMLSNEQVRIVKNEQGRIRTKQRKDYFQEYRILDLTNKDQPLWLAHFHYATPEAAQEKFTAAHLKIADQHLATLSAERQKELTDLAPIDYVLRAITDPAVFFNLQPKA